MNGNQVKQNVGQGLTEAQAEQSRREHGANILSRQRGKSFLRRFFSNLNDPVIRILMGALAVNLILLFQSSDWIESAGIAGAILLATLISTLSEHSSAKAFERLSREASHTTCRVRRGGTVREIPIADVVVGDLVLLSAGERIPADGLLVSGELCTDQSAMTGESAEIRKIPSSDFSMDPAAPSSLFRGCTLTSGWGEMEVCAVGDASFLGQISREVQMEQRDSPLKLRLARLAKQISRLGYCAALLVAIAYLFNTFALDSGMRWEVIWLKLTNLPYLLTHLFHAFTLGLTVLVVAVPEGLPMMIAVVLSSNIKKMVRDQVLVRKPVGIEAAGSMNILFTDKTGTLTAGKMKLTGVIRCDGSLRPLKELLQGEDPAARLMSLCFRFGNDATRDEKSRSPRAVGGSATERALLESVLSFPAPVGYRVTDRLPFDSGRKYSAVSLGGNRSMTLLMGAPEKLLPLAQAAVTADGSTGPLEKQSMEQAIRTQAAMGKRVLVVALSAEGVSASYHKESIRGSLILVGAVCLSDPLRAEAAKSVAALQDAGIRVVMITGDNPETARAIATGCGILSSSEDLLLTGSQLSRLSDLQLTELLPHLSVVARALPTDKSRLVRLAQEAGLVVGMTGDGINDAPALRRADVGFAMGSGTQVAKDAGDIIILDNNLASIVRAVLYGRTVFKSIRKFITLQLTMNLCAVGVTMICPFLGIDSPVTVVQMLWINVIMDTLGGLAFAGEPPRADYMREPPKRRDEPILNRYMVNQILLLGGFTVALCLYFLKTPAVTALFRTAEDRIYLLTAFFGLFIFSSVFNCFNARTDRLNILANLRKNPVFCAVMLAILAIQLVFLYLGGSVLRTAPLTARELLITMLLSLSVFPADLIRKAIWRLRGKKGGY